MRSIKGVKDYETKYVGLPENLNKLKPDYLIHGDDWKKVFKKLEIK